MAFSQVRKSIYLRARRKKKIKALHININSGFQAARSDCLKQILLKKNKNLLSTFVLILKE